MREEAVFRRKDGSSLPVEFAANPVMDDKGFIGAVITFEDITKRKMADQALRKSEKSLKEAQRIARIGNWERDLITNSLTWSDEIFKIFEIDPEQCNASYEAFLGSVHPDDREFVSRAHTDSVKTRIPLNIVYRLLSENGRVKYVKEKCETEYDATGRPLLSIGTVQDITEQRVLEEQLRQSQKMEVVGHLAGGIAHDFNNILSAIIGYGSMAQTKMKSSDPLKYNIDQVLEAANRAAHLTRSLLTFSRKQTLHMKPSDLNEVIRKLERLLVRLIGEDIDFRTYYSGQPLTIMADSGQIEQVLMNLVANARDAMPKGGLLAIRTERTTINSEFAKMHDLCRPGEYAVVSVTDTGTGMDAETQKKIFEPFFTTKELGKGTGLGLSMVYGIISQHEGVINVQSESGKGSTFRIYLPLISAGAQNEDTSGQWAPPVKGTETILVAEDDRTLRRLAVSVLEEYGYTVIEAVDGEDAVSKFEENHERIGLLLFDLVMPKMTGKEAYNIIRAVSPEIRVIFLSGYSPDILRDKVSLENEASVLFKPVHPRELLMKIRSVLDNDRA